MFGFAVVGLTTYWNVAMWRATSSNANELVIVTDSQVVKGRGLGPATAAAACSEGVSSKEIVVADDNVVTPGRASRCSHTNSVLLKRKRYWRRGLANYDLHVL